MYQYVQITQVSLPTWRQIKREVQALNEKYCRQVPIYIQSSYGSKLLLVALGVVANRDINGRVRLAV